MSKRQKKYTIETYANKAGEHQWRVRAENGEIVIPPEGYKNKGDMIEIIESLQFELEYATIVEVEA